MQDDDAMEFRFKVALATGEPFYVLHPDGIMRDETGRFPDKPAPPTRTDPSPIPLSHGILLEWQTGRLIFPEKNGDE